VLTYDEIVQRLRFRPAPSVPPARGRARIIGVARGLHDASAVKGLASCAGLAPPPPLAFLKTPARRAASGRARARTRRAPRAR